MSEWFVSEFGSGWEVTNDFLINNKEYSAPYFNNHSDALKFCRYLNGMSSITSAFVIDSLDEYYSFNKTSVVEKFNDGRFNNNGVRYKLSDDFRKNFVDTHTGNSWLCSDQFVAQDICDMLNWYYEDNKKLRSLINSLIESESDLMDIGDFIDVVKE